MLRLDDPVSKLAGVGPRQADRLARLGIQRIADLLWHLPLRYEDRSRVVPIAELVPETPALVEGRLVSCGWIGARRRVFGAELEDAAGQRLSLRFFRVPPRLGAALKVGVRLRAFGVPKGLPGALEMHHPELQFGAAAEAPPERTLTPIYPATEGLHNAALTRWIRAALALAEGRDVASARADAGGRRNDTRTGLEELLPECAGSLVEALRRVHAPPAITASMSGSAAALNGWPSDRHAAPEAAVAPGRVAACAIAFGAPSIASARARLVFEEFVAHQAALALANSAVETVGAAPAFPAEAPAFPAPRDLWPRFVDALPFALTRAQARAIAEIHADQSASTPMQRLLQGDVGAGKTIVAQAAILQAIEAGYQAAFMAPTELLARQHAAELEQRLEALGVEVCWLAGTLSKAEREQRIARVARGDPLVAVGTHALFQSAVQFGRLGCVVIDEQHRFGVHQRMQLVQRGAAAVTPHQLIMTATPIPRTLAMAQYRRLAVSVLDERPPGRKPVITAVVSARRRDEVIERIRAQCAESAQVYWVCPLIEDSEKLAAESAEGLYAQLCEALPELRVGLVHGRLKPAERDAVMAAFRAAEIDVLVATTVIEVGVDVPNATLMVIENAERMGLAQLHQLRGRVGRGARQSYCVLLYGDAVSDTARRRLAALREHDDGFKLAEIDLELRGPGELLGTRQTGEVSFRVADWARDRAWFEPATHCALELVRRDPARARRLVERWLGAREAYSRVG